MPKSNGIFYVFQRDNDKPTPTVEVIELGSELEIKKYKQELRDLMFEDVDTVLEDTNTGQSVVFGEEFNTDVFSNDYLGDLLVCFVSNKYGVEPLDLN